MGLLWPGLMGRFGDVLGCRSRWRAVVLRRGDLSGHLPLRLGPHAAAAASGLHAIPMGVSGIVGTFCVVSVNAWMNNPTGFTIQRLVDDVARGGPCSTTACGCSFSHVDRRLHARRPGGVGGVCGRDVGGRPMPITGWGSPSRSPSPASRRSPNRLSGMSWAYGRHPPPSKLAAFELDPTTEPARTGADRWISDRRRSAGAMPIPRMGRSSPGHFSMGTFTAWTRFPVGPAAGQHHPLAFQSWSESDVLVRSSWWCSGWPRRRGRDLLANRWFLRFSVMAGPTGDIAVELGWVATEVGRQPWTVWQVLRTSDAAEYDTGLWWMFAAGVLIVYAGLTVGAFVVLRSMARRWRAGEQDLPSPYAPEVFAATSRQGPVDDAGHCSSPPRCSSGCRLCTVRGCRLRFRLLRL